MFEGLKNAFVGAKDKIKNTLVKTINDATPAEIPTESKFMSEGILIPYEFTQAGDRLIMASKMWKWESAKDTGYREPLLDVNKQYLKGTTISKERLKDDSTGTESLQIEGGWGVIGSDSAEIPKKFEEEEKNPEKPKEVIKNFEDSDTDEEIIGEKTDAKKSDGQGKALNEHLRIYEVHITYDRHYLTPRFWLSGVDYQNKPLTKEQIMEEVMSEYREKTVTFDKQPHTGEYMVNIHPCKHANVLKNFANQAKDHGNEVRPDQSLFLFLKFIGSVMPSVEVDFTVEMEL